MSKITSVVAAALALSVAVSAAHAAVFTVTSSPVTNLGNGLSSVTVYLNFTNATYTGISSGSVFNAPTGTTFNYVPVYDDEGDGVSGAVKAPAGQTATLDDFLYASEQGAYSDAGSTTLLTPADAVDDTHFLYVTGQTGLDGDGPVLQGQQTAFNQGGTFTKKTTNATSFTTLGFGGTGGILAFTSSDLTQPLAQLVFPSTDTQPITYSLVDALGNVVTGSIATTGTTTPEPASLGVLALGGAALLTRRKTRISK